MLRLGSEGVQKYEGWFDNGHFSGCAGRSRIHISTTIFGDDIHSVDIIHVLPLDCADCSKIRESYPLDMDIPDQ